MRINIPTKLEKYKEHIKKSSYKIAFSNDIRMMRIGNSDKENNFKQLYICYNPYNVDINLDINHFDMSKYVYKIYPKNITIPAKEISTFLLFTSKNNVVSIDNEVVLHSMKQKIKKILSDIEIKSNQNQDIVITIDDKDYNSDSTMLLDEQIKENDIENIDLDGKKINSKNVSDLLNKSDIDIELEKISTTDKVYKFDISIKNKSQIDKYNIEKIYLNAYDKNKKEVFNLNSEFNIKPNTSINLSFEIEKEKFKDFIIKDLKIKVFI